MRKCVAISFLLNVQSEFLRQIAKLEMIPESGQPQKDAERGNQQHRCRYHQRSHPFDRQPQTNSSFPIALPVSAPGSPPARSIAGARWHPKPFQRLPSAPPVAAHSLQRAARPPRSAPRPLQEKASPARSRPEYVHPVRTRPRQTAAHSPLPAPAAAPAPKGPQRRAPGQGHRPQASTNSNRSGIRTRNRHGAARARLQRPVAAPFPARRARKSAGKPAPRSSPPAIPKLNKRAPRRHARQTHQVPAQAFRRAIQEAGWGTKG